MTPVIETLELEESVVERYDPPKLLVDWPSPWQEFVTSVRPAFVRSERRLAGEAPFGLIPLRIMLPSYVVEAFLIVAAISVQVKIAELHPIVAPRFSSHDVIYYSGNELPRTEDLGGSQLESPVAPEAAKRTIKPRPSGSPAAVLWFPRSSTPRTSSFPLRATRSRIYWPSGRIPVLHPPTDCAPCALPQVWRRPSWPPLQM